MEALKKISQEDPLSFIEYKYHYYALVSIRAQMEMKLSEYAVKNPSQNIGDQQQRIDALGEAFVYMSELWEHAQLERKAATRLESLNLKIAVENFDLKKENEKLTNTLNGLQE